MNKSLIAVAVLIPVLLGVLGLLYYGFWRVLSDKGLMQAPIPQPSSQRWSARSIFWTVFYFILGGVAIWYLHAFWLGLVFVAYFVARRLFMMWAPARFWAYLRGSRVRAFAFMLAYAALPILVLLVLLLLLATTAIQS